MLHPNGMWRLARGIRAGVVVNEVIRVLASMTLALTFPSGLARGAEPAGGAAPGPPDIGVHPMLVSAAADVWSLVARPDNPVWPGWDASDTPLLLYLPGRQELLINHPHPPEGFRPYGGPLSFPGGRIAVRDGATLIQADGQNTAIDLGGVRTLVVADPLSNLRQNIGALIGDPRPAAERVRTLEFESLLADPYEQLALVVHEAFHVYQERVAPGRGANEMFLLFYPVLSVENNVGFGLEAAALEAAIEARDEQAFRAAARRWLAIRLDRRSLLPPRAIEYEDGTEFNEGLAKYTEFRLSQALEGRTPSPELVRAQGFAGYGDLSFMRRRRVSEMKRNLRGEVNVNNDPYGTAPLRFRLYYSGMGIGLLLDRLSPSWKHDIIATDSSLTALARAALRATPEELATALAEARADTAAASLRAAKVRLAAEGGARNAAKAAAIERGSGTRLVVDYGALASTRVALAFSPFGLTAVDSVRTLFEQVPISATFSDGSELKQDVALPLLRDTRRREVSCRLEKGVSRAELERLLGRSLAAARVAAPVRLALPDVTLDLKRAVVRWESGTIRATLVPAPGDQDSRSRAHE